MSPNRFSLTDYKRIYRIFVISLLSVLLVSQGIIQYMISGGKYDATIIKIAGEQGMLSQDIAKTVLNIRLNLLQGKDNAADASTLKQLISTFETNHYALLLGNDSLGIHPYNSPDILSLFREVQQSFLAIQIPAKTIAHQSSFALGMDNDIDQILGHEQSFLHIMEQIVSAYNAENLQKIRRLQLIEILLALITFILITGEIFLLYTPLLKFLQQRNRDLQSQYDRISHFLFVISHNIRRPVANLLGLSDLLSAETEKMENTVEHIRQTAVELDEIIRDLNQELQGKTGLPDQGPDQDHQS